MNIHTLTIEEAHALLTTGEITSVELTRAVLDRIAAVDPAVRAYVTVCEEAALAEADAADTRLQQGERVTPLTGIPYGVKDCLSTKGVQTTCSSKILASYVPRYDATAIRHLREAGAVLVGKQNMDEFGMGSSCENSAFFDTHNPWDLDSVPGGSSGGSAAAVSAQMGLFALGEDTGGSVRMPAGFCGVTGLKPTYGRVSRYGLIALASSFDSIGPFTHTVRDAALVTQAIAGQDPYDSTSLAAPVPSYLDGMNRDLTGIRLGVPDEYFAAGIDPGVEAAVRAGIDQLVGLGAEVQPVSLPHTDYAIPIYYLILTAEASSNLARFDGIRFGLSRPAEGVDVIERYLETREAGFGEEVKRRIMLGTFALSSGYYDAYYLQAQRVRTLLRQDFERAFEQVDALVAPVCPTTAFKLGEKIDDPLQMYLSDIHVVAANPGGSARWRYLVASPAGSRSGCRSSGRRWESQRSSASVMPINRRRRGIWNVQGLGNDMTLSRCDYEPVIGMEIHAELRTTSKMFCGCPVVDTTIAEPNTAICPVCTGLPGAMPVVNKRAIEQAMMVGLALNCQINAFTSFERKNYFYPDLPKGYQISQYDHPLATDGWIDVITDEGETVRVGITRAHMEEDTAKSDHFPAAWPETDAYSLIDFNRSGVPLLEIVSEPDMHSVAAAQAYGSAIRDILRYLGVNSGDMEKGVLRFEANVSVRPTGSETLGTRTEIKNLNSFRALTRAAAYEIERQIGVLEAGGEVVQETLGWDDVRGVTFSQRSKEQAHDYRYFPAPDLPPLFVDRAWIDELASQLPELPAAKYERFMTELQLSENDARILVGERALADYFEAAVEAYGGDPESVSKWVVGELAYLMNRQGVGIEDVKVAPEALATLVGLVAKGTINQNSAKDVLGTMFETGKASDAIVKEKGLVQISDADALAEIVDKVLAENPDEVRSYLDGKESLLQWFMGQVMRETRGRAKPPVVLGLLRDRLQGMD